jgi:hypothetical protein
LGILRGTLIYLYHEKPHLDQLDQWWMRLEQNCWHGVYIMAFCELLWAFIAAIDVPRVSNKVLAKIMPPGKTRKY